MTMPQHDPNLLAYLQAWRQYLEQVASAAVAPGFPFPAVPQLPSSAMPLVPPPLPPMPPGFPTPMPPAFGPPPIQPTIPHADHTQQLLTALQAWRQFLEQALRAPAAGGAAPAPVDNSARPEKDRVPPLIDNGSRTSETTGRTPPPSAPGYGTPAPRVGSAYAPEGGSGVAGGSPEAAPRSLYFTAASPDPGPATTWWDSGTATDAAAPPSVTQQAAPTETATGTTDSQGGSATAEWPPKYETVAPQFRDGSQDPKTFLSPRRANALTNRSVRSERL